MTMREVLPEAIIYVLAVYEDGVLMTEIEGTLNRETNLWKFDIPSQWMESQYSHIVEARIPIGYDKVISPTSQ